MKTLKLIFIFSFLLISGVGEKALPNFMYMLIFLSTFFLDIFNPNLGSEPLWFITIVLTIVVLIIFYRCKAYRDRYILILCFISLCMAAILFSGVLFNKATLSFIITTTIFVISSLALIIWNFKPLKKK
ncbi:hypothetical protein CMU88_09360 [Elizabethkingia anophelis]|nr:hypothetical protein [Elizabethkingia anophelis]